MSFLRKVFLGEYSLTFTFWVMSFIAPTPIFVTKYYLREAGVLSHEDPVIHFFGQVFLWFIALYSAGRFLIEFLRNDNRGMFFSGSLSASQVVALPLLAAALIWLYIQGRRSRPEDDGVTPSEEPA